MTSSISEQGRSKKQVSQDPKAPVISQRPYRRLWMLYQILIISGGGMVTAVIINTSITQNSIGLIPKYLPIAGLLLIAFIIGDLISLTLRNIRISLSFLVTFLAHLLAVNALPEQITAAALLVIGNVIVGAMISESIRRFSQKSPWELSRASGRVLLYAAHHAIAGGGAVITYSYVLNAVAPFFIQSFHLQATLTYVLVYSLLSQLILWPHHWLVTYLLLPFDEGRLPRVDLAATFLIAPVSLIVFHLTTTQGGYWSFIIFILFMAFLYIIRSYAAIEGREKQYQEQEKLRREIGTPPNMAELMRRMAIILDRTTDYQWAAFYSNTDDNKDSYFLRAKLETEEHPQNFERVAHHSTHIPAPMSAQTPINSANEFEMNREIVYWPYEIVPGIGYLGKAGETGTPVSAMEIAETHGINEHIAYFPTRTAFFLLPVIHNEQTIGLLALARPGRNLFAEKDKISIDNLTQAIGSRLRNVQQVEAELQRLMGKLEQFTGNPQIIQNAMQQLIERGVDMGKILNAISTHSFHSNLRNVLNSVVEGKNANDKELNLTDEDLRTIYAQVRDSSPDMPPMDEEILEHLKILPSSLNLAFSFRYAWPEFSRGEQFTELYRFFNKALDAQTSHDIVSLQPMMDKALENLSARGAADPAIVSELNRMATILIPLRQVLGVDTPEDQQPLYLNQALNKTNENESSVQERLADPERFIFLNVLTQWQLVITRMLDQLEQGGARLEVVLRQKHALYLINEPLTIALQLKNTGKGVATRVLVHLQETAEYQVSDDAKADIGVLPPGSSKEIYFKVKPQIENQMRMQFQIQYRDQERNLKKQPFADVIYLRESPPPFVEILNPYVAGPALQTGSDVFVGRQDVFKFIDQNIIGYAKQQRVLLLISERRMGKTSVLKQLPVRLQDKNYVHVFLDCQAIGIDPGTPNFFLSLAEAIADGLEEINIDIDLPRYSDLERNARHVFEREFLVTVWEKIGERRLLIAIDEYEVLEQRVQEGKIDKEVILYLRSLMQHNTRMAFIFAGTHALEELSADYWHVLFNIAKYKRIGFLEETAVRRLMTDPVHLYNMTYDDLAMDEMIKGTGGHPFFLQAACDHLVNLCNQQQRNYVTIQQVQNALETIVETGRPHLEFVWQHSNDVERAVLAGLGKALFRYEYPTLDDIVGVLRKADYDYSKQTVRQALQRLEDRFIVQRKERARYAAYYIFNARLYRMWVRKYHALD